MAPAHHDDDEPELPWWMPDGIRTRSKPGRRQVPDEIEHGSPTSPMRRAMSERMRRRARIREKQPMMDQGWHDPDEPIFLSDEGTREVLREIEDGSPLTPQRAATFERMRLMDEVHRRSEWGQRPAAR